MRHDFLSLETIRPDHLTTLSGEDALPRVPSTRDLKHNDIKLEERGVIECVIFKDHLAWRNARTPQAVCQFLWDSLQRRKGSSS